MSLAEELGSLGDLLKRRAGERALLERQLNEARSEAESRRLQAERLEKAVAVLVAMQGSWKERFEAAVGRVVSQGVSGVFGEPWELVVEMGIQNDLPVARFVLRDKRSLETEVWARGGGRVNVVSFLLRVLLQLAARPAMSRLLVLDETFSNVSAEYVPSLVQLLRRIVEEGGFQILLVTHREALADAADIAYQFSLDDKGLTSVRPLRAPAEVVAERGL